MIPFANQRANGQDLATHLLNEHDNEQVIVEQVRGAIARDLHGAFEEWELQADILTKCKKYLYSLSINPDPKQEPLTRDQYMDYISRVEDKLGLGKQPRAIVVHEKYGREHYHVVWSRIDAEKGKAVHIAYDRDKLMMLTRGFARDHGLELPGGYYTKEKGKQKSFHELEQEQQAKHRGERDQLRTAHLSEKMKIKLERHKYKPTGLAEFLGQISGINLIRKKLHHFQDAQRLKVYRAKQSELKDRQQQEGEFLSLRLSLQVKELERKVKALNKVEKRELQSLLKEHKRDQRIEQRGKHNEMPSLEKIAGLEKSTMNVRDRAPDLPSAFEEAQKDRTREMPDLMKAFTKASKDKDRGDKDSGDADGRNKVPKPKFQNLRNRKRDKGNDRER